MSALEPKTTLPGGWRLLKQLPIGAVGSTWLATAPETNFLRLTRILYQRELYRPVFPGGLEALFEEGVDAPTDSVRPHVLPWRIGEPREPGIMILETSVANPTRRFNPLGGDALTELRTIAGALARLHRHEASVNALLPRGIVYWTSGSSAAPVFLDLGIELVATPQELRDPALLTRPWQPEDLAFFAPEQLHRMSQRLPASFSPGSDIYAVGASLLVHLLGANPMRGLQLDAAVAGSTQILRKAMEELDPDPTMESLLHQCLHPDPNARPSAREVADGLQRILQEAADPTTRRGRKRGHAGFTLWDKARQKTDAAWRGVKQGAAWAWAKVKAGGTATAHVLRIRRRPRDEVAAGENES